MTIAVRISAISILFAALIILTYPVWAQDATSTGTRKDRIQQRVKTVKERVETRKENIAQRLEDRKAAIASKEAALKLKLDAFKDKRKAEIVERISNNLNRINERHTTAILRFLDNASRILSRLEERVNSATPRIKDVAASKIAIAEAEAAIDAARVAVQVQAEKDYTLTVTSEGRAKADIKKVRDSLHADLRSVREQVIKAKQAVANAIRVAKSGKLEVPAKEATTSGQ